ncbi:MULTISPECIES: ABC transporter substrate-binding protein [Halomonadaceae]|jgi:ribose transport system substrate-binding protein|uniref:Periplasmic binding protein/LacI transcriptional regulator n=1 Tax=Vreelandella titanicae BH1 TaxID=1204738 RepID=L9U8M3_9GAMM|nr:MULTISPECIES: ABC transporter substrate-binding protein [Halomonas]ELY20976.1 Periplasmic binding protein/LacI transcriptional regulator [Halomonas titanicae BH1]MCE7517162.1 ABC transporter substrate-binding protein [Halomonas titanicae]NVE93043.1 ABC transporter substrate-binding protein [Halomonas titanicae]CAD5258110.1 Periplasmic binding protein/LacI transcriptional regulator [Halomonas sp. 156]CAD5291020.1 Periplasmic binding protein/LacI transcriptional regulator [Halomonas sp. 113]|tara:strand:- start:3470 stop:4408 length:939 start_codon:yes stop_codon:yes gene_type:complete
MKINKITANFRKTALVAACAAAFVAGTAAADEHTLTIGMSFQELNNEYFVTMQEALETAAESLGAEVIVTDARHDVSKQVSDVEDMIQRGIDILLLNPADSVGVETAVLSAREAGVTTVAIDAQAEGPVDGFVGSKNYDAGYLACEYLAQQLDGEGQVALLDGIPVVPILQRIEGCTDALNEYDGIEIVTKQNGRQERTHAMTVTENIIQANPDLNGLFSVNDIGALGALIAIEASGQDIKLVSVDGHPEAVAEIQKADSAFIATSAQYPADMVRVGLGLALAKHWGAETAPAEIPIDVQLIDRDKAADFSW